MPLDEVEQAYERKIAIAAGSGDNDRAQELAIELRDYRERFRIPAELPREREGT